ncbi:uncharacterized protein misp [Engraulis encrasicolus]|uniref:uncharacterized protein misp n=1 Tax=Engraulis encrasicolus TaxID=184585 RepID=UPI002FCF7C9C
MQSLPRKWVLKPLSPHLDQSSDLRTITSPVSDESFSFTSDMRWRDHLGSSSKGQLDADEAFDSISVTRTSSSVTVSSSTVAGEEEVEEVDVVVQSRQVSVETAATFGSDRGSYAWSAGSSSPSTPGTPSSTSSHTGFYSFVDDPTSPEAERNEEWMVSPERQAKMATLKWENSFKVQTYALERKPEKLFEDDDGNGDSHYKVDRSIATAAEEAEGGNGGDPATLDRKDIIRDQAPKKSRALKEQWSALETLDLSKPPKTLVDGFSICYSSIKTPEPTAATTAEPGTIDDNQIEFDVARKRFLQMEQAKRSSDVAASPRRPQSPALAYRPHSPAGMTYRPHSPVPSNTPYSPAHKPGSPFPVYAPTGAQHYASQVPAQLRKYMFAEESSVTTESQHHQTLSTTNQDSEDIIISSARTVTVIEDEKIMTSRSNTTELDAGVVGAQQLQEDTTAFGGQVVKEESEEEATTGGVLLLSAASASSQETPIEREIRIAQEREESLRRARGIQHSAMPEMVEIKTKSLLSSSSSTAAEPAKLVKAKENSRVSFLIQREISRDGRRERSLSEYDVEERRRAFETQARPSPDLTAPTLSATNQPDVFQEPSSFSKVEEEKVSSSEVSVASTADASKPAEQSAENENGLLPCCPHRHADEQAAATTVLLSSPRVRASSSSEMSWRPRARTSSGALASRIAAVERWSTTTNNTTTTDGSHSPLRPSPLAAAPPGSPMPPRQSSFFRSGTSSWSSSRPSLGTFSSASLSTLADAGSGTGSGSGSGQNSDLQDWRQQMEERLQNAPDLIRQDIERDMQREQEHLERKSQSQTLPPQPPPPESQVSQNQALPPPQPHQSQGSQTWVSQNRVSQSWAPHHHQRSISLDKGLDDIDGGSEQVLTLATVTRTTTTTTKTTTEVQPDLMRSSEVENVTESWSVPEVAPPKEPAKPLTQSRPSYAWSVDTNLTTRISTSDKNLDTITPRPLSSSSSSTSYSSSYLPSVSMVTAQPWGSQRLSSVPGLYRVRSLEGLVDGPGPASPASPSSPSTPSGQKGLTETLLEDFEERRAKMRLEESAYAGIQPIDDVNNEVLEATRVVRHKNTRALRWEAGVYDNQDDK